MYAAAGSWSRGTRSTFVCRLNGRVFLDDGLESSIWRPQFGDQILWRSFVQVECEWWRRVPEL